MKNLNCVFLILFGLTYFIPSFGSIDLLGSKLLYLSANNFSFLLVYYKKLHSVFNEKNFIFILYFSLFFLSLFSFFFSGNLSESIIYSSRLFIFISTLFSFFLIFKSFNDLIKLFQKFIFIIFIFEIFFLIFDLKGFDFSSRFIGKGSSSNINIASFSLLFKIPFVVAYFDFVKPKITKGLIFLFLFLSIFIIFSHSSRAAIYTLLIINFGFLFYFLYKKVFKIQFFLLPILTSFVYCIFYFKSSNNFIGTRIQSVVTNLSQDSSIQYRFALYKGAFLSFLDHPFLGVGGGNYKLTSIHYNRSEISNYTIPYHTHNDFLEILTELGIFGFVSIF